MDISRYACDRTRDELDLNVLCGTLTDHSLQEGSFDVVSLIDVIEHMSAPRDDIRCAADVLSKDGLLCIMTPNFRAYRVWGKRWHGFNASYEHVLFFSLNSLKQLLCDFGFEIVFAETHGMVDIMDYYFHGVSKVLPPKLAVLLGRAISNKALRPFSAEHRLLVIAKKGVASAANAVD